MSDVSDSADSNGKPGRPASGDGFRPTDSDGEPWEFAWLPWIGFVDEKGKAQKVPVGSR